MCSKCSKCFSKEEKKKLRDIGWKTKEINYVEDSIVEDKIKELIK